MEVVQKLEVFKQLYYINRAKGVILPGGLK
jgi:hypothetical protein